MVRRHLTVVASPVAEHRLRTRRLSGHGSRAQPLRGMWDLPGPGNEPVSPASAGGLSTTAPPGKPNRTHSNRLCRQCACSLLVQDVLQESVLHLVLMCLQFPPVFEFSVVLKSMNLTFCWMTLNPDLPCFLNSRLRSSFPGGRTTEMMLHSISVPYQEARGHDPSHPGGEAL